MGAWIALTAIVSVKVAVADQLTIAAKLAMWGALWGLVIVGIWILVRSYKKLDETRS